MARRLAVRGLFRLLDDFALQQPDDRIEPEDRGGDPGQHEGGPVLAGDMGHFMGQDRVGFAGLVHRVGIDQDDRLAPAPAERRGHCIGDQQPHPVVGAAHPVEGGEPIGVGHVLRGPRPATQQEQAKEQPAADHQEPAQIGEQDQGCRVVPDRRSGRLRIRGLDVRRLNLRAGDIGISGRRLRDDWRRRGGRGRRGGRRREGLDLQRRQEQGRQRQQQEHGDADAQHHRPVGRGARAQDIGKAKGRAGDQGGFPSHLDKERQVHLSAPWLRRSPAAGRRSHLWTGSW